MVSCFFKSLRPDLFQNAGDTHSSKHMMFYRDVETCLFKTDTIMHAYHLCTATLDSTKTITPLLCRDTFVTAHFTSTRRRSQVHNAGISRGQRPAFRNNQLFAAIVPHQLQTSNMAAGVFVTSPERLVLLDEAVMRAYYTHIHTLNDS